MSSWVRLALVAQCLMVTPAFAQDFRMLPSDPIGLARRTYAHGTSRALEEAITRGDDATALRIATVWAPDDLFAWISAHRSEPVRAFVSRHLALIADEAFDRPGLLEVALGEPPSSVCGIPRSDLTLARVIERVEAGASDPDCARALDLALARAMTELVELDRVRDALLALADRFPDHPATAAAFVRWHRLGHVLLSIFDLGSTAELQWESELFDHAIARTRGSVRTDIAVLAAGRAIQRDTLGRERAIDRVGEVDPTGVWEPMLVLAAYERDASTADWTSELHERIAARVDRGGAAVAWIARVVDLQRDPSMLDPSDWATHPRARLFAAAAYLIVADASMRAGDHARARAWAERMTRMRGREAKMWGYVELARLSRGTRGAAFLASLERAFSLTHALPMRRLGPRERARYEIIPVLAALHTRAGRCDRAVELWRLWQIPPGCGDGVWQEQQRRRAGLLACGIDPGPGPGRP